MQQVIGRVVTYKVEIEQKNEKETRVKEDSELQERLLTIRDSFFAKIFFITRLRGTGSEA